MQKLALQQWNDDAPKDIADTSVNNFFVTIGDKLQEKIQQVNAIRLVTPVNNHIQERPKG